MPESLETCKSIERQWRQTKKPSVLFGVLKAAITSGSCCYPPHWWEIVVTNSTGVARIHIVIKWDCHLGWLYINGKTRSTRFKIPSSEKLKWITVSNDWEHQAPGHGTTTIKGLATIWHHNTCCFGGCFLGISEPNYILEFRRFNYMPDIPCHAYNRCFVSLAEEGRCRGLHLKAIAGANCHII